MTALRHLMGIIYPSESQWFQVKAHNSNRLIMSSPAPTTPSSSPTEVGGESTGGTPRGANYFFGFLITFVGLLIIFIICGIGSRRRLARRRGLNDTLEPLGRFRKLEGGEERPQFYEPPLVVGEDRWSSLMVRTKVLTGDNEVYL